MAWIITPGYLARRAELFDQLATMISAGVPLMRALERQQNSATGRIWRRPLRSFIRRLRDGDPVGQALDEASRWVSPFDQALLRAGAESGTLDMSFQLLARGDREQAQALRRVTSGLAYPLIVIHVALLVFPPNLISDAVINGALAPFLAAKAILFAKIYGIGFLMLLAARATGATWGLRSLLERMLHPVPFLGRARRSWALTRLAASLNALLNAGVNVQPAWKQAAYVSGSPALRRAVASWKKAWRDGATPGETVAGSRTFPDLFSDLYLTGEMSGKLEESLGRIGDYYQDEAIRSMTTFSEWTPRIIYLFIMLSVAYFIITFYVSYFSNLL
jgi:type II secretory pathway component PulF